MHEQPQNKVLKYYNLLTPRTQGQTMQMFRKNTVQNIVVGVSLKATLANPKSQILSLQFAFASIFFGFRSR